MQVLGDSPSPSTTAEACPVEDLAMLGEWLMATGGHQMASEVAMMGTVLPSLTLQTLAMDKLSSARRGTTRMETTRGKGTNRITSVGLARDPEVFREAALRQCAPEKAFHIMTVTELLAPH